MNLNWIQLRASIASRMPREHQTKVQKDTAKSPPPRWALHSSSHQFAESIEAGGNWISLLSASLDLPARNG